MSIVLIRVAEGAFSRLQQRAMTRAVCQVTSRFSGGTEPAWVLVAESGSLPSSEIPASAKTIPILAAAPRKHTS